MPVTVYPLSHGAALKALRSAHEDLRLVCGNYPGVQGQSLEEAIHAVACARREIFESYVGHLEQFSVEAARQVVVPAA